MPPVLYDQVTLSGSVLIHSGRKPTLFWVSLSELSVCHMEHVCDGTAH